MTPSTSSGDGSAATSASAATTIAATPSADEVRARLARMEAEKAAQRRWQEEQAARDAETAARLQAEVWAQAGQSFPALGLEDGWGEPPERREEEAAWEEVVAPRPRVARVVDPAVAATRTQQAGWEWGVSPSGLRTKLVCKFEAAEGRCHFGQGWCVAGGVGVFVGSACFWVCCC